METEPHNSQPEDRAKLEEELASASGEVLPDREVMSIISPSDLIGDPLIEPPMTTPGGPPGPD